MNDIEFGGNDLLQVYNMQQIKHRLNTTGNRTSYYYQYRDDQVEYINLFEKYGL